MENLFIVPLKSQTTVDYVDIITILKPPSSKYPYPGYEIDEVYPEEAIIFAENEDDEEDEILDIDINKLKGYNISYLVKRKEDTTYCLVADMGTYFFPIAHSLFKKPLEDYRLSLDWDSVSCRVSLLANSEKNKHDRFMKLKDLVETYLLDEDEVYQNKLLIGLYNKQLREIKQNIEEVDRDE